MPKLCKWCDPENPRPAQGTAYGDPVCKPCYREHVGDIEGDDEVTL